MPPRFGRDQVRAVLSAVASPPPSEGSAAPTSAAAIDRVAVVSRRRGFVAVDLRLRRRPTGSTPWPGSACATTSSRSPSTTPASSTCRRSAWSTSSTRRPAAGARCGSRPTCSAASPRPPPSRSPSVSWRSRRAGADIIELATDGDWLAAIVQHVRRRRVQAVNAQVLAAMIAADFLDPGAAVVAARGGRPRRGLRRRRCAGVAGPPSASPRSTCSTASRRPGRAGAATSSPSLQLAGLAAGVVAIARPVSTTTERTESEGRIVVLFDVSLSMMATDVEPRSPRRRQGGGPRVRRPGRRRHRGRPDLLQRQRRRRGAAHARPRARSTTASRTSSWPSRRRSATPWRRAPTCSRAWPTTAADDGADERRRRAGARARWCCSPTARRRSADRPRSAPTRRADAGVPVFTIAFGTAERHDHRSVDRRDRARAGAAGAAGAGGRDHRRHRLRGGDEQPSCRTPTSGSATRSARRWARRSRSSPS